MPLLVIVNNIKLNFSKCKISPIKLFIQLFHLFFIAIKIKLVSN